MVYSAATMTCLAYVPIVTCSSQSCRNAGHNLIARIAVWNMSPLRLSEFAVRPHLLVNSFLCSRMQCLASAAHTAAVYAWTLVGAGYPRRCHAVKSGHGRAPGVN